MCANNIPNISVYNNSLIICKYFRFKKAGLG